MLPCSPLEAVMPHPAGTIFVLRTRDLVGVLIRWVTRSRVNHAGVCLGGGGTVEAKMRGATSRQEHPGAVYGTELLSEIERQRPGAGADIAAAATQLLGTPYGFVDIAALGLADLGMRQKWLERIVDNQHALICSQLVDQACLNVGVHLFNDGRMPGRVDPGDLEQLIATGWRDVRVEPVHQPPPGAPRRI